MASGFAFEVIGRYEFGMERGCEFRFGFLSIFLITWLLSSASALGLTMI